MDRHHQMAAVAVAVESTLAVVHLVLAAASSSRHLLVASSSFPDVVAHHRSVHAPGLGLGLVHTLVVVVGTLIIVLRTRAAVLWISHAVRRANAG